MNRCMILTSVLFDSHRTPAGISRGPDGAIDEAQQVTPGKVAELLRHMHQAQRELVLSHEPHRAASYGHRHGTTSIRALQRELVRNGRIAAEILR